MRSIFKIALFVLVAENSSGQAGTYGWSSPAYTAGSLTWTSSDGKVKSTITTNVLNAWGNGYSTPQVYANTNQNQDPGYNCGINGGLTFEVFFGNTTTSYVQQVIDFTSNGTTSGMCSNATFYITDLNDDFSGLASFGDCVAISAIDGTGAGINISVSGTGTITGNNTTLVDVKSNFSGACAPQLNVTVNPPATRTLKSITIKYYPSPANACNASTGIYNFTSGCPSNGSCGSCYRPSLQWISLSPVTLTSTLGGGCSVLPVELLSFTGISSGNFKRFEWSTASEINNDFFTLEKSKDGVEFTELGRMEGAGNSSGVLHYSAEFSEVDQEYVYYRLKQTDYNGQFEYFAPIAVHFLPSDGWSLIFANPAGRELKGTLITTEASDVVLEISDALGRMVQKERVSAQQGSNSFTVNIDPLDKGVYFIKVAGGDNSIVNKFIKQ